jgi:hypothetical protein
LDLDDDSFPGQGDLPGEIIDCGPGINVFQSNDQVVYLRLALIASMEVGEI